MMPPGENVRHSDDADPIRLGIVGCGSVAQLCHLKALEILPQFDVSILCDRKPSTALAAKTTFGLGAAVTENHRDFAGQVDAAIVCVWPRDHLEVSSELMAMGIDVLCEKPVAISAADATAMAGAAGRSDRILAVGQWCRCLKSSWLLRRVLSLGLLGEILEIDAEFGNVLRWPMSSDAYFDRRLTPGGVMFDAGIHVIDLVVWLFGEIFQIEFEDDSFGGVEANGILRGAVTVDGRPVPCHVAASWTHALRNCVRIRGTLGEAEARLGSTDELALSLIAGGRRVHVSMPARDLEFPFSSSNPYAAQLEDFAMAVRTRRAPITPVDTAILPIKIIEAAYAARRILEQPWLAPWVAVS
ncbi:MAG TPA: Gfo/Idh/MocA family oxidoreductase [Rhizomicrobium sp.]|jgi:predicted dehydrogenase|nr:Gfo/Idh/MocA family oxidoreductase [Rhizomicrobium sp.]